MLDRMREPNAGVALPFRTSIGDASVVEFLAAGPGVSSTRRRNCVLFMVTSRGLRGPESRMLLVKPLILESYTHGSHYSVRAILKYIRSKLRI